MKSFSERSPLVIGLVGVAVVAAIVLSALNYKKLPFLASASDYSALFPDASGLRTGAAVQVYGFKVGEVTDVRLQGAAVMIDFKVSDDVQVGDRSEAEIKTKSLLGAKVLEVIPRGDGQLSETIPTDRTKSAYELPDAIGDLSHTIQALNTNQLNDSLKTLSETFKNTPADLKLAVEGVSRFSQTINDRDSELRGLLENANKVTGVLARRSDQIVGLIADTNALLGALRTQSAALDQISGNISALSKQLSGFIGENRQQLKPALEKLNGALTIVDNHKDQLTKSLKLLNQYITSLGESVAAGPFFKAYLANLLPGQFVQPFVDAAFSDLGLDPNVLLPSQLNDPQTGQPGTPPLPLPYPRTGQGGDPNLTLPGAITGNPGDPRYPYREPPPAPAPGGPPPGPPESAAPAPTPMPVNVDPSPAPENAPSPDGRPQ
jgi:phospholipid/cholesterol/gamma-HCH transport system substrate-binding protein